MLKILVLDSGEGSSCILKGSVEISGLGSWGTDFECGKASSDRSNIIDWKNSVILRRSSSGGVSRIAEFAWVEWLFLESFESWLFPCDILADSLPCFYLIVTKFYCRKFKFRPFAQKLPASSKNQFFFLVKWHDTTLIKTPN
jgi:hypothetical protein